MTVSDEGPGIRGDVSRIFQRFYTDRPDAEHFGDHSGLGLSISRQIIDAHKGTIRAENRTDRSGALFTLHFNRAQRRAAVSADERPRALASSSPATGVMLRGPSGSGKSLLALLLLDACEAPRTAGGAGCRRPADADAQPAAR